MDLDKIRTSNYFPTIEILPKAEAKTQKKKIKKAIDVFFKSAGNGCVFNPDTKEKITIAENVNTYTSKHSVPVITRELSSFKADFVCVRVRKHDVLNRNKIISRIPKI